MLTLAAIAFGIGIVAGLRSTVAPAGVSFAKDSPGLLTIGFVVAAAVELIIDKLPNTPSRLQPPLIATRCLSGAACAYFLCGSLWLVGIGALGALAGSYGGAAFRRRFSGLWAAAIEDAAAVGLAAYLAVLSR